MFRPKMRRIKIGLLAFLLLSIAIPIRPVFTLDTFETTTVEITATEDKYINYDDGATLYTAVDDATEVRVGRHFTTDIQKMRGWFKFNLSGIPDDAIIVSFNFTADTEDSNNADTYNFTSIPVDPETLGAEDCFNYIGNSTILHSESGFTASGNETITLGEELDSDCDHLEGKLSGNWFYLGLHNTESTQPTYWDLYCTESGETQLPTLTVEYYTEEPATYRLSKTYYENGTLRDGSITVSNTFTDDIEVSNTTGYNFTIDEGEGVFTWGIGSATRRYYVTESENITVTYPEATYQTEGWNLRDYASRIGESNCYLEALRDINGTLTVIERMIIYNTESEVPLNLVVGKTYYIRILLDDGSYYNFGWYTADGADPPTINVYGLGFDDRYQPMNRYVTINATRPNATHIQFNYQNTLSAYSTVLVNTSIYRRSTGTLVYNNSTNSSDIVIYNWYGANSTDDYIVASGFIHSYYGNRTFARILAGVYIPDEDPPDFSFIMPTELVSVGIILGTIGTISHIFAGFGLVAGSVIAYALDQAEWIEIPTYLIVLAFALGVGLAMSGRG